MKRSFFRSSAWNNVKKNYRFFVPRILAEAGLLACVYIAVTLTFDERIRQVRGGDYVATFMALGTVILGLLSFVLMLYTNGFLMKQRRGEFGLYNILGMDKRHVSRILFHENFICSLISITLGALAGILMYKLCSLLICRLLDSEVILGFYYIRSFSLLISAGSFFILDMFIYAVDRISIARMSPIDLLHSRTKGEREPRIKWVLLVFGVICLATGYGLSLRADSPPTAIRFFFPAVILVILGTYFLFVSGSILVLKTLKRNHGYYYSKKHFISVSGLLYRMKQNAVGLASIAILSTGVLVMISTTVSLYTSIQDTLSLWYPQDAYLTAEYGIGNDEKVSIPADILFGIVEDAAADTGLETVYVSPRRYLNVAFGRIGDKFITDLSTQADAVCACTILTEEMYIGLGGERFGLEPGHIAICSVASLSGAAKDHFILGDRRFEFDKTLDSFPMRTTLISSEEKCYIVVCDEEELQYFYDYQKAGYGAEASEITEEITVMFSDRELYCSRSEDFRDSINSRLHAYAALQPGNDGTISGSLDSYPSTRESLVGMYGTFLFLGIILGTVCLFATALIVYYKQISEGYEDRDRFQIMKKVGMSDAEVRKSIRPQILLVFFLPLIVCGIHMLFAYPILEKMLQLLMLSGTVIFVKCSVIVFLAFTTVYVVIYSVTAKSYYKIIR